ncbi:hypothetical protein O6H91_11G013100 [Diphasiastrum complanatum]|uniref:Uncharacterized protein n=1 Tax=Diphasiastrum complanatum TaxID=34168 RepID=A0ACC2C7L4_DIPCM|nr:hypothetical protein O6H91_Y059800 [Diphasiastrum complanatum]KAJ7537602.1 hypothetical protein O6H91_11G013100 [Diphasiastrum complanatum]
MARNGGSASLLSLSLPPLLFQFLAGWMISLDCDDQSIFGLWNLNSLTHFWKLKYDHDSGSKRVMAYPGGRNQNASS